MSKVVWDLFDRMLATPASRRKLDEYCGGLQRYYLADIRRRWPRRANRMVRAEIRRSIEWVRTLSKIKFED